jgi:hypothetical protein
VYRFTSAGHAVAVSAVDGRRIEDIDAATAMRVARVFLMPNRRTLNRRVKGWLLAWRPLWDIVMWGLSLAGLVIAASGVVIGWRRLVR